MPVVKYILKRVQKDQSVSWTCVWVSECLLVLSQLKTFVLKAQRYLRNVAYIHIHTGSHGRIHVYVCMNVCAGVKGCVQASVVMSCGCCRLPRPDGLLTRLSNVDLL